MHLFRLITSVEKYDWAIDGNISAETNQFLTPGRIQKRLTKLQNILDFKKMRYLQAESQIIGEFLTCYSCWSYSSMWNLKKNIS